MANFPNINFFGQRSQEIKKLQLVKSTYWLDLELAFSKLSFLCHWQEMTSQFILECSSWKNIRDYLAQLLHKPWENI